MKYLVAALLIALPVYSFSMDPKKILGRKLKSKEMLILLPDLNEKQFEINICIKATKQHSASYQNIYDLSNRLHRNILLKIKKNSIKILIDAAADRIFVNRQEIEGILTQHGDFTIASIETSF